MKKRPLGRSGIAVSEICLGTMTWGTQNTEADGHRQMDMAVAHGVNFFDTAEMYPVTPIGPETYGRTEEIIGSWFKARGNRDSIVLATKVAGPGRNWIDDGAPLSGAKVRIAVERSLRRLQTDYIDLYQLHWPNRATYHFRKNWGFDAYATARDVTEQAIADTLGELQRQVEAGKIRHAGLSNETAWGTMQYVSIAERHGLPRMQSVQNEYSLLCRTFDLDMAEVARHEDVGLLAFTPLGGGLLTGKYTGGALPKGSRATINTDLGGRYHAHALEAADAYVAIARKHGLDPAQMAIAWCLTRPFLTSAIIGATSDEQLETDLGAATLTLDDAVIADIEAQYRKDPIPL